MQLLLLNLFNFPNFSQTVMNFLITNAISAPVPQKQTKTLIKLSFQGHLPIYCGQLLKETYQGQNVLKVIYKLAKSSKKYNKYIYTFKVIDQINWSDIKW